MKIGDKVKVVSTDGTTEQKIYTGKCGIIINEYHGFGFDVKFDNEKSVLFDKNRLKIVTSHLEELIEKVNEGNLARQKLNDYRNEIEVWNPDAVIPSWYTPRIYGAPVKYRIKSKNKKFKVAQWDVEIEGDNIRIGCKSFMKIAVQDAIKALITCQGFNVNNFHAKRNGIEHDGHHITWEQAEMLLKELES